MSFPHPPPAAASPREKARRLHELHTTGRILVLPNAWDVASAHLVAEAGATAVATTSAGVAWSLGVPDGDRLDRDRALDLVARVAAAVELPVTADIESGFGDTPEEVAGTVTGVIAAGAVGVNIEDGRGQGRLRPVAEMAERIAAARGAADAVGVPLYLNARVDTYLGRVGAPETWLGETLSRAAVYLEAGASGIFVPGVVDPTVLSALVDGIAAPLNVLASPGGPAVGELEALGVARVSVGSRLALAAYALTRRATRELLTTGTYDGLAGDLSYGELNALLDR